MSIFRPNPKTLFSVFGYGQNTDEHLIRNSITVLKKSQAEIKNGKQTLCLKKGNNFERISLYILVIRQSNKLREKIKMERGRLFDIMIYILNAPYLRYSYRIY